MNHRKFRAKIAVLCLPGLVGFFLFYLYPFVKSLRYAFINNVFQKEFVWFDNYIEVWKNKYFQQALKNTLVFSCLGVLLLLILSFLLALGISRVVKKAAFIKNAFLLPMLLPTVSVIAAWKVFFDSDVYFEMIKSGNALIEALPIYAMYLWKNTGMNVILLTAAFTQLPEEVLEAAELDGARGIKRMRFITLPLILPTMFFVGILSFVNSMKIFKESFLFFGTGYPPDAVYTVQYYMNNHFQKFNYQKLSCASTIVALMMGTLIFVVFRLQNKAMKDVSL